MDINSLLEEYDVEIDDVRWYLSKNMGERFISFKDNMEELTRFIWSGTLATELHNMEEGFLNELQDRLDREITDESTLREIFSSIVRSKKIRHST